MRRKITNDQLNFQEALRTDRLSYSKKTKVKNCVEKLDFDEFRKFFFGLLRQNDLEQIILSYLDDQTYKPSCTNIDEIKDDRISTTKLFEFMESNQKNKISMSDYKKTIFYFDETADEQSLSVQGNKRKHLSRIEYTF